MQYTQSGWPASVDESLRPYWCRCHELKIKANCLLWGMRVVVPASCQSRILQDLHQEYGGMTHMKSVARSYMLWPNLDSEIEALMKDCTACQSVKIVPTLAPLHSWVWPSKPWQHLHVDYAGPFQGWMFLVVIDAHSKWPEVQEVSAATTEKIVTASVARFVCEIWAARAIGV